eukprot:77631-Pelagomonas_calceolata.AAC.1
MLPFIYFQREPKKWPFCALDTFECSPRLVAAVPSIFTSKPKNRAIKHPDAFWSGAPASFAPSMVVTDRSLPNPTLYSRVDSDRGEVVSKVHH